MTNLGWVQGPEPEFDGPGTAKADTLDTVVAGAGSNANSSIIIQPDYLQRMRHLAKNVVGSFTRCKSRDQTSYMTITAFKEDSEAALFLASFVFLTRKEAEVAKISIPDIKSLLIKQFLEGVYGSEVAQSGIYEAMELDKKELIDSERLSTFFPELQSINFLKEKEVLISANPYQSLLTLSLEVRPFFSGILETANVAVDHTNHWRDFFIPVTTRQIMDYAKQNNELPNVGKYLKMLSEAGVNR